MLIRFVLSAFLLAGFASAQVFPAKAIESRIKSLRSVPDQQRGAATRQLALDIRAMPAGPDRMGLAAALANLSTEGDFGKETLQEVATTLGDALIASPDQNAYRELATLVRYEHVEAPSMNESLKAALASLEAEDQRRGKADFTLTDLSGKKWTLSDLRGKVVLVNFWATWCPPCRKEMPDLDALYTEFGKKGLVVLAISDEEESKVRPFVKEGGFTFPVLLDAGGKTNKTFEVQGIPKTFIFNREGKLAAQSIDMRTRGQFLKLLAQAGMQ